MPGTTTWDAIPPFPEPPEVRRLRDLHEDHLGRAQTRVLWAHHARRAAASLHREGKRKLLASALADACDYADQAATSADLATWAAQEAERLATTTPREQTGRALVVNGRRTRFIGARFIAEGETTYPGGAPA